MTTHRIHNIILIKYQNKKTGKRRATFAVGKNDFIATIKSLLNLNYRITCQFVSEKLPN